MSEPGKNLLIHGHVKKGYSQLSATLYHFKDDPDFRVQDAIKWAQDNPDEAWSLPRAPHEFFMANGRIVVTEYNMKEDG